MQSMVSKFRHFAWRLAVCLTLAITGISSAFASGAGPNGINVGFDFNWGPSGEPGGYTASFIATTSASGATLDNCSGPSVTSATHSCDFVISYSIGGVPQAAVPAGGVYSTWTPPSPPNPNANICDQNPANSAPLTLYNCFNNGSFGQVFMAGATGTLSNLTMSMTCLNPAGTPPTGLFALLYQVTGGGSSIPATPLAQVPVDLSTCPTLTSWDGHTFAATDFAPIPLNFSGITLTSGSFYAVYFGGLIPGSQPPGFVPTPQTLTFPAQSPASHTFVSGGTFPINPLATSATPNSGNPITYSSLSTSVCTVAGTTVTIVSAGVCTLAADQAGNASYANAVQQTQAVTIGVASQAITFTSSPPANPTVTGTYAVSATGGASGNPVTFSIDASSTPGACTIAGSVVSFTGAGACIVDANQAGNTNYAAAPQVSQTMTIGVLSQAITFTSTPPANPMVTGTYIVSATGGASGNPVTFSIDAVSTAGACTIAGNTVSFTGIGTCVVDANQAGNASYAAAPQVAQTIVVGKKTTTITLTATPNPVNPGTPVNLIATVAGDPPTGTVGFSDNSTLLSCSPVTLVPGATSSTAICTTTFASLGTHSVTATYSGDANFAPATSSILAVLINAPPVAAPMLDLWAILLLCGLLGTVVVVRIRS